MRAENVVQLAYGTKMSVPAGNMQTLRVDSQTPPTQSKPSAGLLGALHDNTVLFSIDVPKTAKGIIKKFDIIEKMRKHIFSQKHVIDGINKLGSSEEEIIKKIANIILKADEEGSIKSFFNQISTQINGQPVTIRCFIKNGEILMMDSFIGNSSRGFIKNK